MHLRHHRDDDRTVDRSDERRSDRGSVALALLLVSVVGVLAVALAVQSARGARATAVDRDATLAIHNADAGVQAALYALNRRAREATYADPIGAAHPGSTATGTFSWSAVLQTDNRTWQVTSVGTHRTRSRTVVADLRNTTRFGAALLTDRSTRLVGNNVFDTYQSPSSPPALAVNSAVLASNGTITASAASTSAGGTLLYNYLNNPDPQRCAGGAASCTTLRTESFPAPIRSDDDLRFISTAIAACKTAQGVSTLPDWIASRDAVMSGGVAYFSPSGSGPFCFRNLVFDRTTRFSPSPGKAAVVYLEGTMTVAGSTTVNIAPGDTAPYSPSLQVYTASGGPVDWATGSRFAGAVYAPRAACGEKSGASVEIYGALVCGTFDTRGGLRFHYDLTLRTETASSHTIVSYEER